MYTVAMFDHMRELIRLRVHIQPEIVSKMAQVHLGHRQPARAGMYLEIFVIPNPCKLISPDL